MSLKTSKDIEIKQLSNFSERETKLKVNFNITKVIIPFCTFSIHINKFNSHMDDENKEKLLKILKNELNFRFQYK